MKLPVDHLTIKQLKILIRIMEDGAEGAALQDAADDAKLAINEMLRDRGYITTADFVRDQSWRFGEGACRDALTEVAGMLEQTRIGG